VFDPFFSTRSAGRGLGLAVVHKIVWNLRGEIYLMSEPGKGTTFQVLLPCAKGTARATDVQIPHVEETSSSSQQGTVLIVEDEDILRQATAKMLRKRGFEVLEAGNGFAAIDLLRANRGEIDVILLDLTLPGASSQEVVAEAALSQPDSRIILTSAYSEEMANASISTPQVHGFVRKPFQLAVLVQILRDTLPPQ